MNRNIITVLSLVVIIAGGVFFLSTSDIPAPQHKTEKVIPNETFFKN